MYKYTDKEIRYMNRRFVTLFSQSKRLLRQDELNVLEGSKTLYKDLRDIATESFLRIAKDSYRRAYKRALIFLGRETSKSKSDARGSSKPDVPERNVGKTWLDERLNDYDPITGYVFMKEVSRKRARFAESVMSQRKVENVDRAMRLFALMAAQYAIETTDNATMQAYKDNGIEYVMWNTEEDDRVCSECKKRNGKIYRIDQVPPKPHINCRCYFTPADRTEKSS